MATTYLKLFNNNLSLETLSQFSDYYKISFTEDFKIEDFFEKNRNDIFSQYTETERQELANKLSKPVSELTSEDITIDMKLPCPCYLYIEDKHVDYSLAAKHTNFQISETSAIAFEDNQIKSILQDEGVTVDNAKRIYPGCRVLGWFKTMFFNGKRTNADLDNIYNLKQTFLDLSKYIVSLNTSVGESGGSFSISLPHIPLYSKLSGSGLGVGDYSQESHERGNIDMVSIDNQSN